MNKKAELLKVIRDLADLIESMPDAYIQGIKIEHNVDAIPNEELGIMEFKDNGFRDMNICYWEPVSPADVQ